MSQTASPLGFEISVSATDDGTAEAMYIRLADRKVARTKEIEEGVLLADLDSRGNLIGIEVLAPVRIRQLIQLVDEPRRRPLQNLIRKTAPEELVLV